MKDLTLFEYHKCLDKQTGKSLGIVLATGTFTDLDSRERDETCLWTIDDGVCSMKTYVGNEIDNVEISDVEVTTQELFYNAACLYSRLRELENSSKASSRDVTVAYNERNDYIRKIDQIMESNGLMNNFNQDFLMTSLASISFY